MAVTTLAEDRKPEANGRSYGKIEVVPSEGTIGADIVGFDFAKPDADQITAVRRAWLDYSVLRFRGYEITDENQVEFTRNFGDFVFHPRQEKGEEGAHPEYPEILIIGNAMKDGKPAGTMGSAEARWHSDTYIVAQPPAAAILRNLKLPKAGGNTYFCDMYAVYEGLPKHVKRIIDGRQIQIDLVYDGAMRIRKGMSAPEDTDFRLWPAIRHPIVRTHGESGRNALYLAARCDSAWIVGLPVDESSELLDILWERVNRVDYHWTQVWQPNDIIMWDNRCTMHRRDSWDAEEVRIMHRTTTKGELPFFRF